MSLWSSDEKNDETNENPLVNNEIRVLVHRIKDGHVKIWDRWHLLRQMEEGSGKDKFLENLDDAVVRLRGLVKDLAAQGRRECIYKEGSLQDPCLACPVPNGRWDKERCPSWRLEL